MLWCRPECEQMVSRKGAEAQRGIGSFDRAPRSLDSRRRPALDAGLDFLAIVWLREACRNNHSRGDAKTRRRGGAKPPFSSQQLF